MDGDDVRMICKNCGREILEGVIQGKPYYYHCIDFGDCVPEPKFEIKTK